MGKKVISIFENLFDGIFGVADVKGEETEAQEEVISIRTSEALIVETTGDSETKIENNGFPELDNQDVTDSKVEDEKTTEEMTEEITENTTEEATEETTEEATEETTEVNSEETTENDTGFEIPTVPVIAGAAVLVALAAVFAISRKRIKEKRKKRRQKERMEKGTKKSRRGNTEELPGNNQSGPLPEPSFPNTLFVGKVHDIGMRPNQQDSFGLSHDGVMLDASGNGIMAIVADGMGGLSNGAEVSTRVIMSMLNSFEGLPQNMSEPQKLLALLNQANTDVNSMLGASGLKKSGSTVVAALVRENQFSWLTVGDSHIYLYRGNSLILINREHVYGADLDERAARGEISLLEAEENSQRKALTSYIGMGKIEKIDRNLRPLTLEDKDRILLMSDGVFGTLSDTEISAAMKFSVPESCEALHQMIQGKGKRNQDNYTAIVLEYREKNGSGSE